MNGLPMSDAQPTALTTVAADRLARLFEDHYDRLYRLARRLTSSADAARDLVQDTFLRAVRSADAIPLGVSGEEAWLVRVLVNLQRDRWRRAAVRARHATVLGSAPADEGFEPAVIARATVWHALDALTPRRRAVIVLHELEGLEVAAIASLLGISDVTVRWHLARGRRELAARLGATDKE